MAVATLITTAVRMPAKITEKAKGTSILKRICGFVMPMPRAASMIEGETPVMPAMVLFRIGKGVEPKGKDRGFGADAEDADEEGDYREARYGLTDIDDGDDNARSRLNSGRVRIRPRGTEVQIAKADEMKTR